MEYTSIYKNGKVQNFFIKIDNQKEFNFLQPYFLITTLDKQRSGSILEMNCLFSCSTWYGRQTHGWGYSSTHDVYSQLIAIIKNLYKNDLSQQALDELDKINTHDDRQTLSDALLDELDRLNNDYIINKRK